MRVGFVIAERLDTILILTLTELCHHKPFAHKCVLWEVDSIELAFIWLWFRVHTCVCKFTLYFFVHFLHVRVLYTPTFGWCLLVTFGFKRIAHQSKVHRNPIKFFCFTLMCAF